MTRIVLSVIIAVMIASAGGAEENTGGKLIWRGDTSSDHICLTFDDGPHPVYTDKILDILKEKGVKAAFFVMGERAKRYPDVIKRIHGEGHEIGNHTYTHSDGLKVNEKNIFNEISDTHEIIKELTGREPKFFRPPFGFFNYRYFEQAEKMGYQTILWTIDAADWGDISAGDLEKKILAKARGGSIILLHDSAEDREELIKALPKIINGLRSKGFKFMPLTQIKGSGRSSKQEPLAGELFDESRDLKTH